MRPSISILAKGLTLPLLLTLAGSFAAAQAATDNLLENASFDQDIGGWMDDHSTFAAGWNAEDADDREDSGSIAITQPYAHLGPAASAFQCIPIPSAVQRLRLDGRVRLTAPEAAGEAFLSATLSSSACGDFSLHSEALAFASSPRVRGVVGWTDVPAFVIPVPEGAASVQFAAHTHTDTTEAFGVLFDQLSLSAVDGCVADATTLCIDDSPDDNRFAVTIQFATALGGGTQGAGQAVSLVDQGIRQGGVFWFFDPSNPELLVKVLNGCTVNDHYWVFYAASTGVGFDIRIQDTATGRAWERSNPDNHLATPVADVEAFPCEP